MPKFYSSSGNPELWAEKPNGYYTEAEWQELHPPEPETESTLDDIKTAKRAEIANARYLAERAGMSFNGIMIKTDDVSQNKITGAVLAALENPEYTISDWKISDGVFISLSNAQILEIGRALRSFVQEKFTREKDLSNLIDVAATQEEINLIEWS